MGAKGKPTSQTDSSSIDTHRVISIGTKALVVGMDGGSEKGCNAVVKLVYPFGINCHD